jgi:dGTPase
MTKTEDDLRRDVASAVLAAKERGALTFYEVLEACEGADPTLVASTFATTQGPNVSVPAVTRRETSELAALFPAADPVGCQWWYTLDTIERLANRVYQAAPNNARVAFLGAPTVAYQYSRRVGRATLFEIDQHVLRTVSLSDELSAILYDVSQIVPAEHADRYDVVLADPPWYRETILTFIVRALQLGQDGASILCSLPPRLTRPGIVEERQELLETLLKSGVEVVSIERSVTRYLVPEFERIAMRGVSDFDGRPWRSGDLLHVRRKGPLSFDEPQLASSRTTAFARRPKQYRVFLRSNDIESPTLSTWVSREHAFENTVSRRSFDPAHLHWWTSNKRGGLVRNCTFFKSALELWATEKLGQEETRERLIQQGMLNDDARALCRDLDEHLELWSKYGGGVVKERPDLAILETRKRPYLKKEDDGFRGPFQRDRDRITWSRGLRQLANKTQVFPLATGDYLRNRLSHSLEVMQLATTIGASYGLNLSLVEAGALAHDIGHTPFGHAGESALNILFSEIRDSLGFNHYEHGVDVIRWLEDAYQSPSFGGLFGLNITTEVAECVFKHTYCQTSGTFCQNELYKRSKHKEYFDDDLCHLEGQAVRIADKVSYLISDLEDGIRVGALTLADLLSCRLLRRPPLDLTLAPGESAHERFLSQRSLLIGILMEDIILATADRLSQLSSLQDARSAKSYTVTYSADVNHEVEEVWKKLQAGKLHTDGRIRIANLRAARIVRELTLLFCVAPQLIDERFRDGHMRLHGTEYMEFYRKETGKTVKLREGMLNFLGRDGGDHLGMDSAASREVPVEQLIQAKDFVAGLSDERARALHHDLLAF